MSAQTYCDRCGAPISPGVPRVTDQLQPDTSYQDRVWLCLDCVPEEGEPESEKARAVDGLLRAQGFDPAMIPRETWRYWLRSAKTAPQMAALLLGKEHEYD